MHHCNVLHASATVIDQRWVCSLYDPFWRFYRNRDEGATLIAADGSETLMRAGACLLVPAWAGCRTRCHGRVRHTYLHFDPVGLPGSWVRERCTGVVALPPRDDWSPILDALPVGADAAWSHLLRCQAMLCEAMAIAVDRAGGAGEAHLDPARSDDRRLVEPAVAWVESHLKELLPVDLLASRCGLGRDHFTKVFTRAMGSSPARHVAERRIAAAAFALLRGERPIEEVAASVGFANRYHFTRVFRRILRTTPAAYRRQGRLGLAQG